MWIINIPRALHRRLAHRLAGSRHPRGYATMIMALVPLVIIGSFMPRAQAAPTPAPAPIAAAVAPTTTAPTPTTVALPTPAPLPTDAPTPAPVPSGATSHHHIAVCLGHLVRVCS